jgi:hypothetical protein
LGNLSTPKAVQKLQKALHAKAKAEAEYRFHHGPQAADLVDFQPMLARAVPGWFLIPLE